MYGLKTIAAAALLAVGVTACGENTTAPAADQQLNVDLVAVDDYGFTQGAGPGQGCATGPGTCFGSVGGANRSYLGTLVQQAYQKLASEQGRAAADAAFAELWELHQEAFAIRSDRGGFVEAMQAAHAESVKLVLQVLGNDVAAAVIDLAAARLEALKAAIAASGNAARLQYLADRVAGYLADAQARLAARDYAGALDLGSRALQAATVGAGQTVRGASAGTGIGAGGGRQYRGGK